MIDSVIELGFSAKSKLFILPLTDLLKKRDEYRINQPGVVNEQNWSVRFSEKDFSASAKNKLKKLTRKYGRI